MVNKRSSILLSSLIKENNIKCNVLSGSESLDYLVTNGDSLAYYVGELNKKP